MAFTDVQRRCIISATVSPLRQFPVGYASSKAGPFYKRATVRALLRSGALRPDKFPEWLITAMARVA